MSKRRIATPPSAGRLCRHEHFRSEILGNERALTAYLPPGYDLEQDRRYPVLYLHDGQNVFNGVRTGPGATWAADTTANRLIVAGRLPPLILVGVDSSGARDDEYTCHEDRRERAGGRGELYGRFLFEEVKPFIDGTYRTMPHRKHTGVAGSSLGGLISLELARRHHALFSRCGALSPSLWWCRGRLLEEFAVENRWLRRMRFWVDMGTREGGGRGPVTRSVAQARELAACFHAAGLLPGRHYWYGEIAGGEHHETAWAARFDKVLLFFFGW